MAFTISRGKLTRPRRCLLYGPHGIGKTTCARGALVLDVEGGSGDIDLARIDLHAATWAEFLEALGSLFDLDFDEPTVAIDSLDWVASLIETEAARANGVRCLADIEWGKGPGKTVPFWDHLLAGLDKLMQVKGKNILLLAHAKKEKINPPDSSSYQRYEPAIDNPGSAIIQEWCDEVLFYRYRVTTTSEDLGFKKERTVVVSTRERFFQTSETPGALAKNRLALPDELQSFEQYRTFLAK
jgi:hypothetical protein